MDTDYFEDTTPTNLLGITVKTQGEPTGKAAEFKELVKNAGYIEIDKATIATEGLSPYVPEGFSSDQLNSALEFFANGVSSEKLEKAMDQKLPSLNLNLTEKEAQSLYAIPYLVNIFEEADPKIASSLQSSQQPSIELAMIPGSPAEPVGLNMFQRDKSTGTFQPVIKEIVGEGVGWAKNQVKDFAFGAIKKVGKEFVKEAAKKLGKVALKGGAKLAAKAGVTALSGAAAAGTGGLSLLVQAAIAAGKKLINTLKSLLPRKLKELLEDNKGKISFASILVLLGGIALGLPAMALTGLGLGLIGWRLGGFKGLGAAIFGVFIAPLFAQIGITILGTFAVVVLLTALCFLIINSGAYVVPYNPDSLTTRGSMQSDYFVVEKLANGSSYLEFKENPQGSGTIEVNYSITITPTRGSLTNISFQENCNVISESDTPPACPQPTNIAVNFGPAGFPFSDNTPELISPSQPYQLTYTRTYNSAFADSIIVDTFTVTAESAGETTTGFGSASVAIGNPPSDCPSGWPVRAVTRPDGSVGYHLTQGPMGSVSHSGLEAIDIAPYPGSSNLDPELDILYATHRGTVTTSDNSLGKWVRITGNCSHYGGAFSSLQGHLLSFMVKDGDTVERGTPIGIMGNSGIYSDGAHVHYEFQGNPQIIMDQVEGETFIPVARERILGCTLATCNLRIP